MAKQTGPYCITSCIDNLQFYRMEGKYYVRGKSSLTGKRVKKDPAFVATMQYAGLLASASRTASKVYRQLPMQQKDYRFYRRLTGMAIQLLKQGKTGDEVYTLLCKATKKKTQRA